MNAVALITAAGSGTRMGPGPNKIFRKIGNHTVIFKAIEPFLASTLFSKVIVVISEQQEEYIRNALGSLYNPEMIEFTTGGRRRQESVYRGLQQAAVHAPDYILIHDGARPWVTQDIIQAVLHGVSTYNACAPVVQAPDALKKIDDGGFISNHLQRNRTMAIQTPQGFLFNEIYEAHTMARSDNVPYIDDTEIYSTYIGKVFTVPGDPVNRKITFPCDLETAGP